MRLKSTHKKHHHRAGRSANAEIAEFVGSAYTQQTPKKWAQNSIIRDQNLSLYHQPAISEGGCQD